MVLARVVANLILSEILILDAVQNVQFHRTAQERKLAFKIVAKILVLAFVELMLNVGLLIIIQHASVWLVMKVILQHRAIKSNTVSKKI